MGALSEALPIEWGVATRPLSGHGVSGDLDIVVPSPAGAVIAVADGLGHGAEAAVAARAAASVLAQNAGTTATEMLLRCHEHLRPTRGAALSIATLDAVAGTITWVGVGNVDSILMRADPATQPSRVSLSLRGGVVGYRLPPLRVETLPLSPGDWLLMATDGISSGFHAERPFGRSPQEMADDVLRHHGKTTDDALILAVRYRGGAA